MAGTISEHFESRSFTLGKQAARELKYVIRGTASETDAQALMLATAPPVYGGLALDSINCDPVEVDATTGQGHWWGYARYARIDGDPQYTFKTGGGTTKRTQSLLTVSSYSTGAYGAAPDFEGAINVSEDKVEGVDVTTPQYEFSETHVWATGFVDAAYKALLFALTGRTNAASFKGFQAGEVLFLGASGAKRGDELWEITYDFSASPHVTGLVVGELPPITKAGWDYLWFLYADFEDLTGISIVKRPIAAYVERVYLSGDFSGLGIGT